MHRDHRLFRQYPLSGKARISTGEVPTPYHIYDGFGALIGGTVELGAVRRLLERETFVPVDCGDRRSLMAIWICNFTEASLGPHHELQFSFFTADKTEGQDAFKLLSLMTSPSTRMLCHGLWNSTPEVVAYNRELLSLNAHLAGSHVQNGAGSLEFAFEDSATRQPLISGNLPRCTRLSLRATWDAMAEIGFRKAWAMALQPWVGLKIMNPTGGVLARNAVAESFTKNQVTVLRYFDPTTDKIVFGNSPYASLEFRPQIVQYMSGFKFVYLEPH